VGTASIRIPRPSVTSDGWVRRCARRRSAVLLVAGLLSAASAVAGCGSPSPASHGAQSASPVSDTARCPHANPRAATDLPHVSLSCLTGPGAVDMSGIGGRPVIVNVWASWCAPCRRELPLLQRAHQQVGHRVLFLGVDVKDSRSHALAFLADRRVTYPQVTDQSGRFALFLGLQGVPSTILVDGSGRVVDRVAGQLSQATLDRLLAEVGAAGVADG
jgi:cytochrome c biogenesis protein CcmG/thiol:disulfide interchange protein DsbE